MTMKNKCFSKYQVKKFYKLKDLVTQMHSIELCKDDKDSLSIIEQIYQHVFLAKQYSDLKNPDMVSFHLKEIHGWLQNFVDWLEVYKLVDSKFKALVVLFLLELRPIL